MTDGFDLDTWIDDYEAVVTEAKVVQKASLIAEHSRLQQEWLTARAAAREVMHDRAAAAAETALRECEAKIQASELTFKFQGIGHQPWEKLKRKHPPTAAQRSDGLDVDLDTWAPEVVAACAIDPKVTLAQATKLMDVLPPGEFEKLFAAVGQANGEVAGAPKSVLAVLTERARENGGSPTTGLPEESPSDDSSGTLADPSPESSETNTDA
jgi:hypothetical protein